MRTLSAGFQMQVSKPVEPTELVAVIANLIEWNMQLNFLFKR
jgi:DNA-binding response OmpR family regulator